MDDLVSKFKHNDKELRSALTREIRYRKYSAYSIKLDNPLFDQQKCNTDTLISNLKLLLMKTDTTMAAKATMTDLQEAIDSGIDHVDETEDETGVLFHYQISKYHNILGHS